MRLANEIAAAAMEHVQGVLRPGMTEAQAAAEWLGFVHGEGTGWAGKVELALGFSLVWSGPGIKTFTATTSRQVVAGEPTLFEIWVCADGYWCDHTKNLVPGDLDDRYRELEQGLMGVYDAGVASRDDIDAAMKGGCNFPMGPLELLDLVGLDTQLLLCEALYGVTHDPRAACPPLVKRMIAAGHLGRKTGQGFFKYSGTAMFGG